MNAVEIEEAVSDLAEAPFDAEEFPFAFLAAFGNKETTLKRLRATGKGSTNKSDLPGGVLQRNNIHLAIAESGTVGGTLKKLLASPATAKQKAKFALATDGQTIEAENLNSGETLACDYAELGDHFGFFLELAGITTVRQIRENAFDIKATGRLNRLYVELLKNNPDWDKAERREALNHFFARLIFCFFAEDTGIFHGEGLFTNTVQQMTEPDGSNTAQVLSEIFRAMDLPIADRGNSGLRNWANAFPYVNGGLFSGAGEGDGGGQVPRFTKIARSYLLHIGSLDWTKINPDIFGSMIQAVADDEERGALGMHYTSVPNILKVLNPLFLDDLREKLDKAGDRPQALRHLRKRLSRIRVFDPACGSGNFLVIAYKQMRQIEATINERLGDADRPSDIPLTNFRGIELRHFAAEVARLALVIAEYQCDVLHRGQTLAMAEFLPLDEKNWITCGNALRLDWLSICPPTGTETDIVSEHMFEPTQTQARIDFQNEGGETYICGNPPYTGYNRQTEEQKADMADVFDAIKGNFGTLDYVACWFVKAAQYAQRSEASTAFVATNSLCQGVPATQLWPLIFRLGQEIQFGRTSFKWSNLAKNNAGIIVIVVGLGKPSQAVKRLYAEDQGTDAVREVQFIGPYLIPNSTALVKARPTPLSDLPEMRLGNHPYYGSALILKPTERRELVAHNPAAEKFLRPLFGSAEMIRGTTRHCLWIDDKDADVASQMPGVSSRLEQVRIERKGKVRDATARSLVDRPWRFRDRLVARQHIAAVPQVSSERREYCPCDLLGGDAILTFQAYGIYDGPLWVLAVISSRLNLIWIATVSSRMKTDYRYSNTLGWNTFPVPPLSEQNKADLTRRAEDILLAREAHWPATIADLYDPEAMDTKYPDLRAAHDRNDETLERIYIGRRFKNDTERLETLFEMYTEMTAKEKA